MNIRLLIVEDQFIEANNLRLILKRAGYLVCPIAASFPEAMNIINEEKPDLVLLDIFLNGNLTGIDLAKVLSTRNIAFVYLSANSNKQILEEAKTTRPYGFLVKPFRQKDVLVMLDIAWYLHKQKLESAKGNIVSASPQDQIKIGEAFSKIVAQSRIMQNVFEHARIVGSSDTPVLILGENGTGKERIAHCIHQISARSAQPFIVINCGALPASLIESELFGHEKGTFTGATEKRIGKFQQAEGGTIFLDEVGELPSDLQIKFLRVLQEKEIEPIGGKRRKIDVRVIAATNRNLEEDVAAGRFRIDLYYRLNVFPILLPPLRERPEDILLLANHFIGIYAKKEGKEITGLTDQVAKEMMQYSWPGNVRELENLIRRSVLLTTGKQIDTFYIQRSPGSTNQPSVSERLKTMEENDRAHIIAALEHCDWKIYGPGGAAELLNLNVNTLNSRIKKLGIEKHKTAKE